MDNGNARLRRALGGEELAWLRRRLVRKLQRGQPLTGTITQASPTAAQKEAVSRLFGQTRTNPAASLGVDLGRLEQVLRDSGIATSLSEAVQNLEGCIENRHAIETAASKAWEEVYRDAAAKTDAEPSLQAWLADLRASGLLRRLAEGDAGEGRRLLHAAMQVVRVLPHAGITRPVLAAQVTGDSHALDSGRPVGTLVLRAAGHRAGVTQSDPARAEVDDAPADARRALWEAVGVFDNDLTRAALVLNLRVREDADGLADQMLRLHAAAGEPCYLTLRHVLACPPAIQPQHVYICENPAVLAVAARRLSAACPAMVCGHGQPGAAVRQLLTLLATRGATLHYHGDFDWPGIRIAGTLIARFGALPWRMATADYLAALPTAQVRLTPTQAAADTAWDPALSSAMQQHGLAVHEEMVLDSLLSDLAAQSATCGP